jgi:hypothetical protein
MKLAIAAFALAAGSVVRASPASVCDPNPCQSGLVCRVTPTYCETAPNVYDPCGPQFRCVESGPTDCKLQIKVVSATDLPNQRSGWDTKSDPYVVVRITGDPIDDNGEEFYCSTKVVKNNLNPVWNHDCVASAYSGGDTPLGGTNTLVEGFINDDNFFLDRILNTVGFRPAALSALLDPNTGQIMRHANGTEVIGMQADASCPFVRQKSCDKLGTQTMVIKLEDGAYSANPGSSITFEYCFYNPTLTNEPDFNQAPRSEDSVVSGYPVESSLELDVSPSAVALVVVVPTVVLAAIGAVIVTVRRRRKRNGDTTAQVVLAGPVDVAPEL